MCLSPVVEYRNSPSPVNDDDDDDIIIISSNSKKKRRPQNTEDRESVREISLKFRCRMELYKIPILSVSGMETLRVYDVLLNKWRIFLG